jgi:type VI secretion system FHA domain protein
MDDIKAHELAVMAGMQVALKALLDRFDPDNLEKRIEQSSVWDNILPGNRKAKYWELFREHYREIAREAEDDFHGLFGREFSRAYERQAKQV